MRAVFPGGDYFARAPLRVVNGQFDVWVGAKRRLYDMYVRALGHAALPMVVTQRVNSSI